MTDTSYMQAALEEAKKSFMRNEVPVGAVIVDAKFLQDIPFNARWGYVPVTKVIYRNCRCGLP